MVPFIYPFWLFDDDDDNDSDEYISIIDMIIDGFMFMGTDIKNFVKNKFRKLCGKK